MENTWLAGALLGLCLPMGAGAATMLSPAPIAFSNEAHPGSAGARAGRYLAYAKAMHAADIRIVGLLNAKAYPQAAPRLEQTATHYDDAWAGLPWAISTLRDSVYRKVRQGLFTGTCGRRKREIGLPSARWPTPISMAIA